MARPRRFPGPLSTISSERTGVNSDQTKERTNRSSQPGAISAPTAALLACGAVDFELKPCHPRGLPGCSALPLALPHFSSSSVRLRSLSRSYPRVSGWGRNFSRRDRSRDAEYPEDRKDSKDPKYPKNPKDPVDSNIKGIDCEDGKDCQNSKDRNDSGNGLRLIDLSSIRRRYLSSGGEIVRLDALAVNLLASLASEANWAP